MPKFVFIPDKTPVLNTCATRRWGAGVDVQIEMNLQLRPVAVTRDGGDGAYMLSARISAANNEEELRIHRVNAAGVVTTPSVQLSNFSNVWFYSAFLVPSTGGSCIAIWTAAGWGNQILARKFDANLQTVWGPVALDPSNKGIDFVAAVSDGNGGALVAFKDNSSWTTGNQAFRVQRISGNGTLPWGATGTSIVAPGTSPQIPFAPPQIAVGPTEFAVVWEGWAGGPGPANVFGAWCDFNGQLLSGPFMIGTTIETIGLSQRWVAADPAGGFYVALMSLPMGPAPTLALTLSRFDNLATTPRWVTPGDGVAGGGTYALAEAGGGGALLATLGPGGLVKLSCFNSSTNGNIWGAAAAANVANVPVVAASNPHKMAGSLAVGAKPFGGAILIFSNFQQPAAPRLRAQCFDGAGALFGQASDILGLPGSQLRPLLADLVVPSVQPPIIVKPVGGKLTPVDPEADSLICIWQGHVGMKGSSITAQKLGCCKPRQRGGIVIVPDFEFACAVPIDWPTNFPGTINAIFPCGSPKGTFGLVAVPRLGIDPGVNVPGGLVAKDVPPPSWVRMWFDHVPPHVTIELRSHTNQLVASAVPVEAPASVEQVQGRRQSVTFRPNRKLSYVLVFQRPDAEGERPSMVPLGLRMEYGSGDVPPLGVPDPNARPRARVIRGAKVVRARAVKKASRAKSRKASRASRARGKARVKKR